MSAALLRLINVDMANQIGKTSGELATSFTEEVEEEEGESPEEIEKKQEMFVISRYFINQ